MADPAGFKRRCEQWAHLARSGAARCEAKIVGTDGRLWPCLSRIVVYCERCGVPLDACRHACSDLPSSGDGEDLGLPVPEVPNPAVNGQVSGTIVRAHGRDPARRGGRLPLTDKQRRESVRRRRDRNRERMRVVRGGA
jgi:hypothetical protein